MSANTRPVCGNSRLAETTAFDQAVEKILDQVRQELHRQLRLQQAGRFERACSHPSHTDASSYAIAMEEYLEAMGALDEVRKDMTERVLGVTKAMQDENKSEEHLEEEVLQTASTFVGWLVSRARRRQNKK